MTLGNIVIDSLTFLYIGYFVAIFLYIATFVLETSTVLPLQFRQAGVKNGLKKLRDQLLAKGMMTDLVAITSIIALTSRYFIDGELNRIVIVIVILTNAFGTFYKSYLDNRIYNQEYTEDNILRHEKIDKFEKGLDKKGL